MNLLGSNCIILTLFLGYSIFPLCSAAENVLLEASFDGSSFSTKTILNNFDATNLPKILNSHTLEEDSSLFKTQTALGNILQESFNTMENQVGMFPGDFSHGSLTYKRSSDDNSEPSTPAPPPTYVPVIDELCLISPLDEICLKSAKNIRVSQTSHQYLESKKQVLIKPTQVVSIVKSATA